jgi:HSP20 family protein
MRSIFPVNRSKHYTDNYIVDLDNEMDKLLSTFFSPSRIDRGAGRISPHASIPLANVVKSDEGYTIELAAPGMSREDFNISVENNTLTVSSDVEIHDQAESMYETREFSFASFSRSWTLPKGVNASSIGARYNAGIMSVHIPVSSEDVLKLTIDVE